MRKTGLTLLLAIVMSLAMVGMCFAVTFVQFPEVGIKDGKKTCDIYYDEDSLFQQEDGLIRLTTMLDFTPWGVECRLKDLDGFPPNATTAILFQLVNLKTNQIKEVKVVYCDANGDKITEQTLDSGWYTPPPGKLSEIPIEIARNWLEQKEKKDGKGSFYLPAAESFMVAQIPMPGPPVPVDPSQVNPSTGTTVSPSTGTTPSPQPRQKVCVQYKTITIKYACGTERKCTQVKIMDSLTTWHYETMCVDVETYCTKSEEVCTKWEWQ